MAELLPAASQLDDEIRQWWSEHAQLGPLGYWPLMMQSVATGTEMPELWIPDAEPPWDEATKRLFLDRANDFMRRLKAAWSNTTADLASNGDPQ